METLLKARPDQIPFGLSPRFAHFQQKDGLIWISLLFYPEGNIKWSVLLPQRRGTGVVFGFFPHTHTHLVLINLCFHTFQWEEAAGPCQEKAAVIDHVGAGGENSQELVI